jgi:hypothetical protein
MQMHDDWLNRVVNYCAEIFPTKKEVGQLRFTPGIHVGYNDMHIQVQNIVIALDKEIKILENILDKLTDYYQFEPDRIRLFIQDIDSFSKVKTINPQQVQMNLDNGFLRVPEEDIKKAFAQIIGQSYVPTDWGGETEDYCGAICLGLCHFLYSSIATMKQKGDGERLRACFS